MTPHDCAATIVLSGREPAHNASTLGALRSTPRWLAVGMYLIGVHPAYPADSSTMAGDYACKSDCHLSDAPPSIDVDGTVAICRNDLGGVFYGRVLSSTSVSCFNMIGTLSADRKIVRWSNDGVWERR